MTKSCVIALLLIALFAVPAAAVQRVVVAEDFTGMWCQYCPGAARGLDQLYREAGDSLVVLAYHNGDPYQTAEAESRRSYYAIASWPSVNFDGNDIFAGGSHSGTAYVAYRNKFNTHKTVDSPFEIAMSYGSYDTATSIGAVSIKVYNRSASADSGILHFVIAERHLDLSWQEMEDSLDFVVRDMVPDQNGEKLVIAAGDSQTVIRSYTIGNGWVLGNCRFVAMMQRTTKQIIQAGQLYLPNLKICSAGFSESGKAPNGLIDPGENGAVVVSVKGRFLAGTNAAVTLMTSDPGINVTSGTYYIGDITPVDSVSNSSAPFQFSVSGSMAPGHRGVLVLRSEIYSPEFQHFLFDYDTLEYYFGTPDTVYHEQCESGLAGWIQGGTGGAVNWDTTAAQYHNPGHSYTDSRAGNYGNNINRYLRMAAGVDLTSYAAATVSWWEKYSVEDDWDYCYPEYSINGGSNWLTLGSRYTSTKRSHWRQRTVDVSALCATGADFRVGYRLASDGSVVWDGWYVDDIVINGYGTAAGVETGIAAPGAVAATRLLPVNPNPAAGKLRFAYDLSAQCRVKLGVYDITGRLVAQVIDGMVQAGQHSVIWNGTNKNGQRIASGVYFVRLESAGGSTTRRVTVIR